MSSEKMIEWKCTVCGEIIRSVEVPSICPVCGVGSNYFIKFEKKPVNFSSDEYFRIVIVGGCAAGMAAIEAIRDRNSFCDVTLITRENCYGYNRPMLSKSLGEGIDYDNFFIKDYSYFNDNNIEVILNQDVVSINKDEKTVLLESGIKKGYDKLILATGAECFMPPIKGHEKLGVFTLRHLADANDIREYSKNVKTAAVIGGGVLGLETAWELKKLGLDVTVIEIVDRILPRMLNEKESIVLKDIILNEGVKLELGESVEEIYGDDKARGILLKSGKKIESEIIVVSAGVRANTKLAVDTGIIVNRGIVVNEKMETSLKDVYACGDCCEFNEVNYALWSEAIEQGTVAGINSVKDSAKYENISPIATMHAFNTSLDEVREKCK